MHWCQISAPSVQLMPRCSPCKQRQQLSASTSCPGLSHTCTAAAARWPVASAVAGRSESGPCSLNRAPALRSTAQASFMLPACRPAAPAAQGARVSGRMLPPTMPSAGAEHLGSDAWCRWQAPWQSACCRQQDSQDNQPGPFLGCMQACAVGTKPAHRLGWGGPAPATAAGALCAADTTARGKQQQHSRSCRPADPGEHIGAAWVQR